MCFFLTIIFRKIDFLFDHAVYEADMLRAFPVLEWIPATLSTSSRPRMPTVLRELSELENISMVLHSHSACETRLYFTYTCSAPAPQSSFCA